MIVLCAKHHSFTTAQQEQSSRIPALGRCTRSRGLHPFDRVDLRVGIPLDLSRDSRLKSVISQYKLMTLEENQKSED